MVWACRLDFGGNWDNHLLLVGFAYNNSFQSRKPPFEALFGRKCRSFVYWDEVGEIKFLEPELVQETYKKIALIRERLKIAQSIQNCYIDNRR